MTKNNGGPAFPSPTSKTYKNGSRNSPSDPDFITYSLNDGMTLRDWFAGMALQGLIAGCFAGNNGGFTVQGNVTAAYEYADAMLKAREE